MAIILWKNLLKCLPTTTNDTPSAPSPNPLISEQDHTYLLQPSSSSAAAATSATRIKNFNSLYDFSSASTSKSISTYSFSSSDSDSDSPPDFAAIFASHRFFFSSPGRSNSIVETHPEPESTPGGGIAVKKYSADPYADFKHSMQEMIKAKEMKDARADWDYLNELLSCYLSLNPKHTHEFIISAFADIIISLLSESDAVQNPHGCRRHNDFCI